MPFVKRFPFESDSPSLVDAIGSASRDVHEPTTFIVLADAVTLADEKILAPVLRRLIAMGHVIRCVSLLRSAKFQTENSRVTHLIQNRSQLCFAQHARQWLLKLGVRLECPTVDSTETSAVVHTQFRPRTRLRHVG